MSGRRLLDSLDLPTIVTTLVLGGIGLLSIALVATLALLLVGATAHDPASLPEPDAPKYEAPAPGSYELPAILHVEERTLVGPAGEPEALLGHGAADAEGNLPGIAEEPGVDLAHHGGGQELDAEG